MKIPILHRFLSPTEPEKAKEYFEGIQPNEQTVLDDIATWQYSFRKFIVDTVAPVLKLPLRAGESVAYGTANLMGLLVGIPAQKLGSIVSATRGKIDDIGVVLAGGGSSGSAS